MFLPLYDVNPNRARPVVNYLLMAANVLAWFFQLGIEELFGPASVISAYGLVPRRLLADLPGEALTVLTSMFMHGGWTHLLGNMLFLYVFGDNVEDALGHLRYLAFYLVGGGVAALAQVSVDPTSTLPMVGASGAVAGVLGAYVVLYPNAAIGMLNTVCILWPLLGVVFFVPAWMAIGSWFLWNVAGGFGHVGLGYGDGVAYFAHIGGFVVGLLLIRFWITGRTLRVADAWEGWRAPPHSLRGRSAGRGSLRVPVDRW